MSTKTQQLFGSDIMLESKRNNLAQSIASYVSEIFSFFSDTPGGTWALAILCELLQEMINAENWQAAEMVVREMHQVAEVDLPDESMDQSAIQAFYTLLTDCIIETEAIK